MCFLRVCGEATGCFGFPGIFKPEILFHFLDEELGSPLQLLKDEYDFADKEVVVTWCRISHLPCQPISWI